MLCNAHLLCELHAVSDAAAGGAWCWADQAADALKAMKVLVDEHLAKASSLAEINTHRLEELRHSWCSAVLVGLDQTSGRESKLVAKFHALAGAQWFGAVRSYTATAAKHGIAMFDVLVQLVKGQCWMPETV